MIDALKPFIARLIAAGVAALSSLLATKFMLELGPDAEHSLITFLTLAVYALIHKYVDRSINPTDTAKVENGSNSAT